MVTSSNSKAWAIAKEEAAPVRATAIPSAICQTLSSVERSVLRCFDSWSPPSQKGHGSDSIAGQGLGAPHKLRRPVVGINSLWHRHWRDRALQEVGSA